MIHEVVDIDQEVSWMTPIINFLKNDIFPEDKIQVWKIRHKLAKYYVVND